MELSQVITPEIVAFIGILLACLIRTAVPYLKKKKDDLALKFQLRYLVSFVVVVVIGFASAILLFPLFIIPESSYIYIFCAAFAFAWASNDIINKIIVYVTE